MAIKANRALSETTWHQTSVVSCATNVACDPTGHIPQRATHIALCSSEKYVHHSQEVHKTQDQHNREQNFTSHFQSVTRLASNKASLHLHLLLLFIFSVFAGHFESSDSFKPKKCF
jgi:hypothetical protein